MPLPKNVPGAKQKRKAALAGAAIAMPVRSTTAETGPLKAHWSSMAREMSYRAAAGYMPFQVIAPDSLAMAMAPEPKGRTSIEFAPGRCMPGHGQRRLLSVEGVLDDIRRREAEYESDRRYQERTPRREMGDFVDDDPYQMLPEGREDDPDERRPRRRSRR